MHAPVKKILIPEIDFHIDFTKYVYTKYKSYN